MNIFHKKLTEVSQTYANWHKEEHHQAIHWSAFVAIGILITSVIVSNINRELNLNYSSAAAVNCDYYAAPNASSSGTGSSTSPWQLRTALGKGSQLSGKTLCMKGGTYYGKYKSNLVGATVRSAPGEWAKIDGYATTTLANSINATQTSGIILTDATNFPSDTTVTIHGDQSAEQYEEHIIFYTVSGNTVTSSDRGRGIEGNGVGKAHNAGALVVTGGNNLEVNGSDTTYINFEITNSDPVRSWGAYGNSQDSPHYRGECVMHYGPRTKLINLVLHDCQEGIFGGQGQPGTVNGGEDSETYGNVIYNNGYRQNVGIANANALGGHGWYIQHDGPGYKTYKENITFNNNVMGAQEESVSGIISNIINSGNVVINNTFLIGANAAYADNIVTSDNYFYSNTRGPSYGGGLVIGYGDDDLRAFTITNNYLGLRNDVLNYTEPAAMNLGSMVTAAVTGNTLVTAGSSSGGYDVLLQARAPRGGGTYNINNNTYYDQSRMQNCSGPSARTPFGYNNVEGYCGGKLVWTEWKSISGWDSNSTYTQAVAPNKVVVRPNAYETGRGNIIIYNWSNSSSVSVDLSSLGLTNGQAYEIRNVQHYFTNPITGTYNSSNPTVLINMNDTEVTQPVGTDLPTRYTTMPEFGAFVVVPSNGGGQTGDTTPPTVNMTAPSNSATVSGTSTVVSANASDNVGVAGVQFKLDGANLGAEDTSSPYSVSWDTTTTSNGTHTLTAVARDSAGNSATATSVSVTVSNQVAPVITTFSGSPTTITQGSSSTLSWTVTGATSLSINQGVGSVTPVTSGTRSVSPNITTTYTLTATNSAGSTTATTTIIVNTPTDTTPPVLTNGAPSGAQPAGTTQVNMILTTNENATCKYGTVAGTNYGSLPSTFTTTGGTSHSRTLTGLTNGSSYTYYIRCQDTAGNSNTSDYTISFSVTNPSDTTAPTVNITSPTTGSTVFGTAANIIADASDNVGVAGVQFKLDGVNLCAEDVLAPYTCAWNTTTATNGSHTITAIARDGAGNTQTSTITVTVNNQVILPPAATPSITPAGGNITNTQQITLATATTGAQIRYTIDGSNPTSTTGILYSVPFTLSASATVKAIAYKTGTHLDSSVATASFTVTVTPTDPAPRITSFSILSKTQTSATITWKTNTLTTGSIAYSTNRNSLSNTRPETNTPVCSATSCTHTLTITGLTRNTTYYYKITATNTTGSYTTGRASFKTRR